VTDLSYTLLSDGSSDQGLLPLVNWTLREIGVTAAIYPEWANLGVLRRRPVGLAERIRAALDLYPCDLLLVHRDCEAQTVADRQYEISRAVEEALGAPNGRVPVVCVVPRRMTEAWLLISESAVRVASGNPNGRIHLSMPAHNALETLVDPKETLFDLLRTASELHGRRLQNLRVHRLVHRVVELLDDFSPLRALPAFVAFEAQLKKVVEGLRAIGPQEG